MWSMRLNTSGSLFARRRGDGRGGRDHAQTDARSALEPRNALHHPFDPVALEHLVLEQLVRERLELGAMGKDHPLRGAPGLVDQVLALLVANPERRLGPPDVAVRRAPDAGGAHCELVDHRVGYVRHTLEI